MSDIIPQDKLILNQAYVLADGRVALYCENAPHAPFFTQPKGWTGASGQWLSYADAKPIAGPLRAPMSEIDFSLLVVSLSAMLQHKSENVCCEILEKYVKPNCLAPSPSSPSPDEGEVDQYGWKELVRRRDEELALLRARCEKAEKDKDEHIRDKHRILGEYESKVTSLTARIASLEGELAEAKRDCNQLRYERDTWAAYAKKAEADSAMISPAGDRERDLPPLDATFLGGYSVEAGMRVAAAARELDSLRASLAQKDAEIERLKRELEYVSLHHDAWKRNCGDCWLRIAHLHEALRAWREWSAAQTDPSSYTKEEMTALALRCNDVDARLARAQGAKSDA